MFSPPPGRAATLLSLLALVACADTNTEPTGLARDDVRAAAIVGPGSYDLPNPIFPSGLAYDGAVLWITNVSGDGITYELDPTTVDLTAILHTGGYPRDVTYHAGSLYLSDVSGVVYQRIIASDVLTSSFPIPFRGGAIANDGSRLYIGDTDGPTILVTDLGGVQIRSFDSGLRPEGMVYDPVRGTLWVITLFSSDIYEISTNGVLLQRCDSPYIPGLFGLGGIAIVGANFWIAHAKDGDPYAGTTIRVLDRATLVCEVLEPVINVAIDVKPGSLPNSINPKSNGVIPVAILSGNGFDAALVDASSVRFGRVGTEAAAVHSAMEDVDGDGDVDMIMHFRTQDSGIVCGDVAAHLTGQLLGGGAIQGSDAIVTAGCK